MFGQSIRLRPIKGNSGLEIYFYLKCFPISFAQRELEELVEIIDPNIFNIDDDVYSMKNDGWDSQDELIQVQDNVPLSDDLLNEC
ncbi:hypothetical protein ABEB36_006722 [Hypothenemus hampei]|uniref:Uncharacterized protein n=1 Tax=Hypothenemus hampei TaxID=57062 RepID=A0ABD1ES12_HYPHA